MFSAKKSKSPVGYEIGFDEGNTNQPPSSTEIGVYNTYKITNRQPYRTGFEDERKSFEFSLSSSVLLYDR
jgi:hypothetical protein